MVRRYSLGFLVLMMLVLAINVPTEARGRCGLFHRLRRHHACRPCEPTRATYVCTATVNCVLESGGGGTAFLCRATGNTERAARRNLCQVAATRCQLGFVLLNVRCYQGSATTQCGAVGPPIDPGTYFHAHHYQFSPSSTPPPQICVGFGNTPEAAEGMAFTAAVLIHDTADVVTFPNPQPLGFPDKWQN